MIDLLTTTGAVPCLINNEPYTTLTQFTVYDPHNTAVELHRVYGANVDEAIVAVEAAQAAFSSWRDTSYSTRRDIFLKAAALVKARKDEFIAIECRETTSSIAMAQIDIMNTVATLEELAGCITSALQGGIISLGAAQMGYVTREPFGVCYGSAPWNCPIILGCRAVANAIIGGNTAVLKTSEYSPLSHNIIGQVFIEAGLPPGVLNIIHVSSQDAPKVTEAVIAHPAVRKVNFTGSTKIGRIIGSLCGQHLKPVLLELGGAAPFIVLPSFSASASETSADLHLAAQSAIYGGFLHSGQICMATNSIIVHESVADEFVEIVTKELRAVKAGAEGETLKGLFNDASKSRVLALVKDAVSKGANVVVGDTGLLDEGNVIQPFVLDNITPEMNITHEEIFGPAITIQRFSTDAQAITIANSSDYGLAAAVYGRDVGRATNIARALDVGLVHVNGFTVQDHPTLPHGGVKNSGFGRFNGLEGIREFTHTKVMTVADLGPGPTL